MPPPPAFLPSSLLAPPCVLTWRRPSPTVRTRRTPPTPSRSARLTPRAAAGGGAVISVSDLRLQAGTRDLVYIDRWALTAGNCVGIVGANGGKRVFFSLALVLFSLPAVCEGGISFRGGRFC